MNEPARALPEILPFWMIALLCAGDHSSSRKESTGTRSAMTRILRPQECSQTGHFGLQLRMAIGIYLSLGKDFIKIGSTLVTVR